MSLQKFIDDCDLVSKSCEVRANAKLWKGCVSFLVQLCSAWKTLAELVVQGALPFVGLILATVTFPLLVLPVAWAQRRIARREIQAWEEMSK